MASSASCQLNRFVWTDFTITLPIIPAALALLAMHAGWRAFDNWYYSVTASDTDSDDGPDEPVDAYIEDSAYDPDEGPVDAYIEDSAYDPDEGPDDPDEGPDDDMQLIHTEK